MSRINFGYMIVRKDNLQGKYYNGTSRFQTLRERAPNYAAGRTITITETKPDINTEEYKNTEVLTFEIWFVAFTAFKGKVDCFMHIEESEKESIQSSANSILS